MCWLSGALCLCITLQCAVSVDPEKEAAVAVNPSDKGDAEESKTWRLVRIGYYPDPVPSWDCDLLGTLCTRNHCGHIVGEKLPTERVYQDLNNTLIKERWAVEDEPEGQHLICISQAEQHQMYGIIDVGDNEVRLATLELSSRKPLGWHIKVMDEDIKEDHCHIAQHHCNENPRQCMEEQYRFFEAHIAYPALDIFAPSIWEHFAEINTELENAWINGRRCTDVLCIEKIMSGQGSGDDKAAKLEFNPNKNDYTKPDYPYQALLQCSGVVLGATVFYHDGPAEEPAGYQELKKGSRRLLSVDDSRSVSVDGGFVGDDSGGHIAGFGSDGSSSEVSVNPNEDRALPATGVPLGRIASSLRKDRSKITGRFTMSKYEPHPELTEELDWSKPHNDWTFDQFIRHQIGYTTYESLAEATGADDKKKSAEDEGYARYKKVLASFSPKVSNIRFWGDMMSYLDKGFDRAQWDELVESPLKLLEWPYCESTNDGSWASVGQYCEKYRDCEFGGRDDCKRCDCHMMRWSPWDLAQAAIGDNASDSNPRFKWIGWKKPMVFAESKGPEKTTEKTPGTTEEQKEETKDETKNANFFLSPSVWVALVVLAASLVLSFYFVPHL